MSNTAVPLQPVQKGTLTRLCIGLALVAAAGAAIAWSGTGAVVAQAGTNADFLSWNKKQSGVVETASGLQYQVVKAGEGDSPTDADVALINYVGTLRDGKQFDKGERTPFPVTGVVPGFTEALKLMQKGGKYRIWLKPELAYGDKVPPGGPIPADALLTFDVELIDFIPMAVLQQMQMQQQMQMPGGPGGQ
ncbi:FKBP-type peptidyl-prolyl cis-trans isomerase [Sphingomonas flavalba]|uniref:FKBP-type peptidyl-prolyl cis-trans isomerase n=1 Tax=Sphingomonas flavalba TaxID=2559804 RepID=UPI0039DFD9B9